MIWGIHFGTGDVDNAVAQIQAIMAAFTPGGAGSNNRITLDFVEIGNEADLYVRHGLRNAMGQLCTPLSVFVLLILQLSLQGTPRPEIFRVSRLIGTKFVANEFVAHLELQAIQIGSNLLSLRAYTLGSYTLCGFGNLSMITWARCRPCFVH